MGEEVKENANNDLENSSFKEDYIGILELSPIERLREYMYQYFAKIQTDTNPKFVFSVVTGIFLCIQAIFPALMQQADIQHETSTIGRGMRIISVLWCGGGAFDGEAPFITSIIASIITLLIIITISFRSFIYSKVKSMKPTEINIMFTISTYILPILTSFTTCCVGDGIYKITNGSITAFEIISVLPAIFVFIIQAKMQYDIISPRVMFIRDITLMWTPFSSVLITIVSGVNAAIFSATVQGNKYAKTV